MSCLPMVLKNSSTNPILNSKPFIMKILWRSNLHTVSGDLISTKKRIARGFGDSDEKFLEKWHLQTNWTLVLVH